MTNERNADIARMRMHVLTAYAYRSVHATCTHNLAVHICD